MKAIYEREGDECVYDGDWQDGKPHGRGTVSSVDGRVIYEGDWQCSEKHGFGTMWFPSGSVYTGPWRRGKRHGVGHYVLADGSVYDGLWVDDKIPERQLRLFCGGVEPSSGYAPV